MIFVLLWLGKGSYVLLCAAANLQQTQDDKKTARKAIELALCHQKQFRNS